MATKQSGEDDSARLRVGIIAGSTRPGRQSKTVAEWVCADPIPSLDLRLIDLPDSGLPLLCEPSPAASGRYQQHSTRSWSATALRALRLRTTSSQGQGRPALNDPSVRAAAVGAVERLVAGLQDGVDHASADAYGQRFASDVLWGSPYGATLSGYGPLNAAHRSLLAAGVAPQSRYDIVHRMSSLPGVAIVHVRRNDISADTGKRFSEMACTCSSNAAGGGGWPPARTRRSLNVQHDRQSGAEGRSRAS